MSDGAVDFERARDEGKLAVEVAAFADAAPELLVGEKLLRGTGLHVEELPGGGIEVGEDAIAVEKELVHGSGYTGGLRAHGL